MRTGSIGALSAVLLLAASQSATGQAATRPISTAPAMVSRDTVAGSATLLPGDIVRLRIWREPDLSGDFPVDERGTVVFPKIGPTQVLQMTTDSLKQVLMTTYAQYLRDPAIEVTFLRRVTVLGAVKNPGLYPVDPTMTVSDAVALAGGALPNGRPHNFELRRGGQHIDVDFNLTTPIGHTPIRSGDEIYVPERSWLSRNGPLVIGASITAVAIIVSAVIRY